MKTDFQVDKRKTRKPLLFISMISIVMLFIGFTSGYIVRQAEGNWMEFDLPDAFFLSTAVIILSSLTIQKSLQAARNNQFEVVKRNLAITLALGLSFAFLQFDHISATSPSLLLPNLYKIVIPVDFLNCLINSSIEIPFPNPILNL